MIANLVRQNTATTGTGTIVLGTAVSGYTSINDKYSDGDTVFYTIEDVNNREIGIGTFTLGTTELSRDTIFEKVEGGVYTDAPGTGINLSGVAVVTVAPSLQALTTHLATWKRVFNQANVHETGFYASMPLIGTLVGSIFTPVFGEAPASNESIPVKFYFGHDIADNTNLYVGVMFAPEDNTSGVVRWGFEYSIAEIGGNYSAATTLIKEETVAISSSNDSIYAEFTTPIVIPSPDCVLIGRLYRDTASVNDTYAADAKYIDCTGAYQATKIGTPKRISPYDDWT